MISGAVISALALGAILLGSWPLAIWVAIGAGAMGFEMARIVIGPEDFTRGKAMLAVLAAGVPAIVAQEVSLEAAVLAAIALTVAFSALVLIDTLLASTVLLVGIIGALFVMMRGLEPSGLLIAMWIPLVTAFTDMGGYFVGRKIGGRKLAPKLSPKKTISGSLGGMVAAVIVSLIFALLSGGSVVALCALAIAAAVVAIAGDLLESWAKRRLNVKDAGTLIPGHGGVMDRFDGLAAVTLFIGALLVMFPGMQAIW